MFKRKKAPEPFVKAELVFDSGESAAVKFAEEHHWHDWYRKWRDARREHDSERVWIHDGQDGTWVIGSFLDVEFINVTHVQGKNLRTTPDDEEIANLFPGAAQL